MNEAFRTASKRKNRSHPSKPFWGSTKELSSAGEEPQFQRSQLNPCPPISHCQSMDNLVTLEVAACTPSRTPKRLKGASFSSNASEMECRADVVNAKCSPLGLLSQGFTSLKQTNSPMQASSERKSRKRNLQEGSKPASNIYQMSPSSQNEKILLVDNELGNSSISKTSNFNFDGKQNHPREPIDAAIHQSTASFSIVTIRNSNYPLLGEVIDKDILLMAQKPRSAKLELSPWHMEVTNCVRGFQSMSSTKTDWALAVNRLVEKTDVECELRCSPSTTRSRWRLTLTMLLMQKIFPSLPARFLAANATALHESILYRFAKLVLTDTCRHMCFYEEISVQNLICQNMANPKPERSEKDGICSLSNIIEHCLQRFRRLEDDFLRFEEGYSALDFGMQCQDLDKYAMIIRLAIFHEQSQTDGAGSSIQAESCGVFPQIHLATFHVPKLPDGLRWLSL